MSEPFVAEMRIFAGNFAPRGWAYCDGQLLPINQNQALFSLVGTTFGGDGRTTFGLPNLQGRAPMGPGHGPGLTSRQWGQTTGNNTVTLTTQHLPQHSHTFAGSDAKATLSSPTNNRLAVGKDAAYTRDPFSTAMEPTQSVGGGQPVDVRQPYLALSFIIATVGVFPSRN